MAKPSIQPQPPLWSLASSTGVIDADAPGTTPWNYSVLGADLDFLAEGESITFGYTVTATDSEQATATTTVAFTITGTNDAPTVSADRGHDRLKNSSMPPLKT